MIAGPLYGEEGIVAADCDLRLGLRAKRWFDAAGHYSREDLLLPQVTTAAARLPSMGRPVKYPVEEFTPAERALLEPHFTNLDRPVFCLVNLPETVKGALFARYSRYPGTLRRLFLEEFAGDLPDGERPFDGVEGERAAGLYERVFIGYGDDSIAQVGGAHVACEWVSNVLTKVLQRGRLAAYLEQSTRYIPYDQPIEGVGGYRYYADDELGPDLPRDHGRAVRDLLAQPRDRAGVGGRALAALRGRARTGLAELDPGQGPRPASRPAPRLDPEPRRHLCLRPGVRAAAAAARRLAPPGGARLRRHAPGRARPRHRRASSPASTAPTAAATGSSTCASAARRPSGPSPAWGSTAATATRCRRWSSPGSTAPRTTC